MVKSKKAVGRKPAKIKQLSKEVRKRLVPIRDKTGKLDKARRFKDKKTGKIYSRRSFETGRKRKANPKAKQFKEKFSKYTTMRDIFISSQKKKGKHWTKREAMQSDDLKKIIKDLHNSNLKVRQKAFRKITGGEKEEWVPYIERWVQGNL